MFNKSSSPPFISMQLRDTRNGITSRTEDVSAGRGVVIQERVQAIFFLVLAWAFLLSEWCEREQMYKGCTVGLSEICASRTLNGQKSIPIGVGQGGMSQRFAKWNEISEREELVNKPATRRIRVNDGRGIELALVMMLGAEIPLKYLVVGW